MRSKMEAKQARANLQLLQIRLRKAPDSADLKAQILALEKELAAFEKKAAAGEKEKVVVKPKKQEEGGE